MTKMPQRNTTQISFDEPRLPRILLINSDAVVCAQLQRLFAQCAYLVSVLQSGQQALEQVADGSTDLVVTDVHLPDLDGIRFIERLRKLHSDVPVIVITGERDI